MSRDAGGSLTMQRIQNRGNQLIVGVFYDYAPFSFLDSSGTVAGLEPDLVRALAAQWNVDVTFVPVTPSTRLQSLLAGQIDIIAAALPHSFAHERAVDFSAAYARDSIALLIPTESPTDGLQTLAGKTIATIQGDSATARLEALLAEYAITANFLPFQEPPAALAALKAGQADALLGISAYLSQVAEEQLPASAIVPLGLDYGYGFGLVPGDPLFRNMVNETLQALAASGAYATIYQRWFGATAVPSIPTWPGTWPYTFDALPARLPLQQLTALESRITTMRTRGVLLAGVPYDMAPFGFLNEGGVVDGFEIGLVREFARRWLGDAEAVEFVRVTPDTAMPLLNAGQVDLVAAALTHSWPHAAEVDFSTTYYQDTLGLLVRADDGVASTTDLAGATLATVTGSKGWNATAQLLREVAGIQPPLLPFQEYRTAIQALLAGQVHGVVGSTTVLRAATVTHPQLQLLPDSLLPQPYGVGVPLFADEVRDLVNITLQAMWLDGSYAQIYRQWFTGEPYAIALWSNEATLPGLATNPLVEMAFSPAYLSTTAAPTLANVAAVSTDTLAAGEEMAILFGVTPAASPVVASARGTPARIQSTRAIGSSASSTSTPMSIPPAPLLPPSPMILVPTATPIPPSAATLDGPVPESSVTLPMAVTPTLTSQAAATATVPLSPTVTPAAQSPLPLAIHRVRATDALTSIAKEYYGQQAFWPLIYEANRETIGDDPNIIPVGAELVIPVKP
ncbi:MAG: transporter substrate-binding domain-containing protein [Caldilineaceae bacterium]|nr:transporter substrate-binding domain-containing protein [Caldilineaceae bacterium]